MYCDKCSSGWVRVGRGYNRCECIREKIVRRAFVESSAPRDFYKFKDKLEDQKSKTILGDVIGYLELLDRLTSEEGIKDLIKKKMTIVLKGNPGSGKSQFATTLALEIMKTFNLYKKELEPKSFYFLRMGTLKDLIFKSSDKKKIEKKMKNMDVLILDDLGTENYDNAWTLDRLNDVLRAFDGILIITTNYIERDIHIFYKSKNKRLYDVLVNTEEKNHGKGNCLFYIIARQESRRIRKAKKDLFP